MITMIDIKKSYIDLLRGLYGKQFKYYGLEIKEGYIKPSFFIAISPIEMGNGINARKNVFNIYTTYFQKEIDELDCYTRINEIRTALGNKLAVADRFVNVSEFNYTFIGKDRTIAQLSFTVDYFNSAAPTDQTHETMQEIKVTRG